MSSKTRWARRAWSVAAVLGAASLSQGCSESRPSQLGQERCTSYEQQVKPLLNEGCAACHSGVTPQASYSVDGYQQTIARRPDGTFRVKAGDEASPLLEAARGNLPGHSALPAEQVTVLEDWVVRCELAPADYGVHPNGWMDQANTGQFHGRVLRQIAYDLKECQSCHGEDLSGGKSKVSCLSCHSAGVNTCTTCHGRDSGNAAPPRDLDGLTATTRLGVGAHQTHLKAGPTHKALSCETCHQVPAKPEDDGHYQRGGELDASPAEVQLPVSPAGVAASWDREAQSCTTYCHAPVADTNALNQAPKWTLVGQGQAACGTCHGLPPSTHSSDNRCVVCHAPAFAAGQLSVDTHLNGTVELSAPSGGCVGCHGENNDPAPPKDLLGRREETFQTVGAHQAHLTGRLGVSNPVACTECHLIPGSLRAPGHIDTPSPAEVFPTGAGTLARADGATPTYNANNGTCSNVYCHGGGSKIGGDAATSVVRTPSWTGGTRMTVCGACHGVPPKDAVHGSVTSIAQCASCHGASVDATGAIRFTQDPATGQRSTKHLDGNINLGAQ